MPSVKTRHQPAPHTQLPKDTLAHHILFWPLVGLVLLLWVIYRQMFTLPVWFDEIIGKALLFGLPVWIYCVASQFTAVGETFSLKRMERGLLLGLAMGGVYGFVTAIMSLLQQGRVVVAAPLFASSAFWYEFGLAIMTSFWESLFFFSFIGSVIFAKYAKWSVITQIVMIVGLFMLFHLPNIILRFSGVNLLPMVLMLSLFALGQALVFYEYRNGYTLVLSQAIWGMVLLIHGT